MRRLVPATALVSRDAGGGKTRSGSVLPGDGPDLVLARAIRPTALLSPTSSTGNGGNSSHVAGLGATLFTDHLIAVELAGALLFVALVGAISMATPRPPIRPATRAPDPAQAKNVATASASF